MLRGAQTQVHLRSQLYLDPTMPKNETADPMHMRI